MFPKIDKEIMVCSTCGEEVGKASSPRATRFGLFLHHEILANRMLTRSFLEQDQSIRGGGRILPIFELVGHNMAVRQSEFNKKD